MRRRPSAPDVQNHSLAGVSSGSGREVRAILKSNTDVDVDSEGVTMQMDDMILVSIDDHMVEPPDMFKNHVPAKWHDEVPKVVRNEQGVDEWVFQGQKTA